VFCNYTWTFSVVTYGPPPKACGLTGLLSCDGTTITYYFAGALADPFGSLAVGTPFTGWFSYAAAQPNLQHGQSPYRGDYLYQSISLTFGSTTVTDNGTGVINLYDHGTYDYANLDPFGNPMTYPTDLFHLYTFNVNGSLGGLTLAPGAGIQLVLQDETGTAWPSTALPGAGLTMANLTEGQATFIQLADSPFSTWARGPLLSCPPTPVAKCKNVTVPAESSCSAHASINDGSFDPDGHPITLVQTPPGPYPLGTTEVTLTVTDTQGASSSCTATVTVIDNQPPVITCPANIVLGNDPGTCVRNHVTFTATAADNCPGVTIAYSIVPGSTFPTGTTPVTATATDAAGNQTTCTFTVTVNLTENPGNLYPIALNAQTLAGMTPGSLLPDIFNGIQPGNFGWLTWAGSPNVPTLAASLTPPGDSFTYVNPANAADHVISVGDWVQGKPGVSNSSDVRKALDVLKTSDINVPIWDQTSGNGNNTRYRVAGFAKVRIISYQLAGQNRITARYLGPACP